MTASPVATARPLCIDLDGTLLRSDLLLESTLALLAHRPWLLLVLPFWLLGGKARLKQEIASRVVLDAATLPYDGRVLALLREATARRRVLCTASDARLAQAVAAHLGCFDEVLASDGQRNLSGRGKAEALVARFGERGFDYAGNARVDLAVWARAHGALVVNAGAGLARAAAGRCELLAHLPDIGGGLTAWLRALRLHQWLKNLLVFIPLLASHRFLAPESALAALGGFVAFGLCASGVYVLNDLLDLPSDRQHPRKRLRPFASGALPLLPGIVLAPLLALAGLALAWWIEPRFAAVLAAYYLLTLAYSLRFKRVAMLDVMLLAALYTLRIIGGTAVIGAALSFWLLAFSMFIFLSLALLKRYVELAAMLAEGKDGAAGRGYGVDDLPLLQSLGGSAGYLAVLVLALYINSPESIALYTRPQVLWLLCPLVLYWVSRTWVVAHRGGMDDDPVVFAVTDRASQLVGLLCAVIALAAI
ncbi:MAG TPA: UbiA family prenyltransferase [Arenimonas sp.]|uniref:UbiA family prenyltransferase n=1 Tax=Arenimonas sp. TaxID=1872635 RepID=UPI002D7ED042|nr:UbiA family prenyltransferase [Arenimonas sp.]HEU0151793.1 UbiA family prenyltransferase [Arenimonas sp.]